MIDLRLTGALAAFYARAWYTPALRDYIREHHLDVDAITIGAGAFAVLPIVDCGHGRFDFGKPELDPLAFVHEALDETGEVAQDLVAWPLAKPANVLTMLGRAGIIGLEAATNPATYHFGKPLTVHETPLQWLQAGCKGAAIASKRIAARELLDLPGPVCGRNKRHSQELLALAQSVVDASRFLSPVDAGNVRTVERRAA